MLAPYKKARNYTLAMHFRSIAAGLILALLPWGSGQAQMASGKNSWLLCEPDPLAKFITPDTGAPKNGPFQVTSTTGQSSESEAILQGDVHAQQGDQRLEASQVTYYRLNRYIKAEGDVNYGSPDMAVHSSHSEVNLDDETGWFSGAEYYVPSRNAKGSAERVDVQHLERTSQLRQATYSTCERGNEFWQLRARHLELDQTTERGIARHVTVAIEDIPILYLPYLSFPLTDKRQSGFLTPSAGYNSKNGFQTYIPYYWNIGPNQDMTVFPRIFSERGLMLGAQYRFLTPRSQGELDGEYLPFDAKENRSRGGAFIKGQANPWSGLYSNLLFQYVSDKNYLNDFSNKIDLLSDALLERHLDVAYSTNNWTALARAQNFQTLDQNVFPTSQSKPYARLPQLLFDGAWPRQAYDLTYVARGELVNFAHHDDVHGLRLDLWPKVNLPLRWPGGFLKPQVSYRYTTYQLEETTPGMGDQPSRGAPIVSLDSGLFFERPVRWKGWRDQPGILTLEPRLFYLYVPYRKQSNLPLFDTTLVDPSYAWLFLENRFTGADRLGDANQLTTAMSSRLLSSVDGSERLRFSVGQIHYFNDPRVTLNNTSTDAQNNPDLFTEAFLQLPSDLSLRGTLQWDTDHNGIRRSGVDLRYRPGGNQLVNIAYRFANDIETTTSPSLHKLDQIDISVLWAINERWRTVARWNYSLLESRSLELLGGFEYEACCWALSLLARQHRDNPEESASNEILVQLELKGLGGLGSNINQFLEKSILGYESRNW